MYIYVHIIHCNIVLRKTVLILSFRHLLLTMKQSILILLLFIAILASFIEGILVIIIFTNFKIQNEILICI